jgi:hypothetical protein
MLAAALLLPVERVDRSDQAAENGLAIHRPYPFEDVPQGLKAIFIPRLGRAGPFLAHKGS